MKRVLLLVLLIVSLVELDWERSRIYLLSAIVSMLLVVRSELVRRRKFYGACSMGALTTGEPVTPVTGMACSGHARNHFARVDACGTGSKARYRWGEEECGGGAGVGQHANLVVEPAPKDAEVSVPPEPVHLA